jgi:inner membrane protein
MDNLTHSLVGAVLGQAGLKRTTGLAMPALIIGANLPDVDAACFFWLEGTEHLAFRRGITHGPPALVLLPLILAGLLWGWDRWQTRRGTRPEGRLPVRFGWLYAMAFIGCLSHPFFDWLNVYGIRLLEPFSSQWFYGDTLFIIDPWLWALLIASIWLSRRREKAGAVQWARPAQVGIAAVLAYIGVNAGITASTERALLAEGDPPELVSIAAPVLLAFWQREELVGNPTYGQWYVETPGKEPWLDGYKQAGCDLEERRKTDPQLDAFLFWSRAPYVHKREGGAFWIGDARFTDERVKDRFAVPLPRGCRFID